jgi:hypothetical protein
MMAPLREPAEVPCPSCGVTRLATPRPGAAQTLDSAGGRRVASPGAAQTPDDFRELENLSKERRVAAQTSTALAG